MLRTSLGALGISLPGFFRLRSSTAASVSSDAGFGKAKRCIVLYCWGGMSHLDTWDLKPDAPAEVRGEFRPIATAVPGIQISEHMPHLARHTDKLAIVRSIHHGCTAHGKGMYWNMTGHAPPQPEAAVNLPPSVSDWPSLGAMVSALLPAGRDVPSAVRLPYPMVDNNTLQAGEYGGWLGVEHDPIVVRTPKGTEFGGVSRDMGRMVLNLADGVDRTRLESRRALLDQLSSSRSTSQVASNSPEGKHKHFQEMAANLLLSRSVQDAFEVDREPERLRNAYGQHICGQSMLLARRLTEVGVPIVTVCCAAGDLNGSKGDHWDTHVDNFNRLKNTMLPALDQPAATLLGDLADRGTLDETLVVMLTEFGRSPKVSGNGGREHYPFVYSVALAGGGIGGGQVYGSSDAQGAFPDRLPCGPNDLHATIFHALGIPLDSHLNDQFGRPLTITDGHPLPLF